LHQRLHVPNGPNDFTPSYYVHDRLGSVRLVVYIFVDAMRPGLFYCVAAALTLESVP
jgi:hypothetical protein